MFVVSPFSRDSEACTHAGEERGPQMNRRFRRYPTRSSAGIPSESRLTRKIHDSPQRHREHREISRIDDRQQRTLHLFRQTKKRVNFIFFLVFSVISVSLW